MRNIVCPTIILKRIEVFFLREWVDHHVALGVDRFLIYDNGFIPVPDETQQATQVSRDITEEELQAGVWSKKPDADYNLDLSNDQIDDALNDFQKEYSEIVQVIPWEYDIQHKFEYPISQGAAMLDCMKRHKRSGDWAHLCIDVDEFIVLYQDLYLKDLWKYCGNKTCMSFQERTFQSRVSGKPVREIFNYSEDDWEGSKYLSTTFPLKNTERTHISVHHLYPYRWMQFSLDPLIARKYHYRGRTKLHHSDKFNNLDYTMKKYL